MMEHTLAAEPTHSVWDRSLEPRLRIEPGDDPSGAETANYEQLKSLNILGGPLDPATAYSLQFAQ
jgi:hypothetical protein